MTEFIKMKWPLLLSALPAWISVFIHKMGFTCCICVNILTPYTVARWSEAADNAWSSNSTSSAPASSASSHDAPSFTAWPDSSGCFSAYPAHGCYTSGQCQGCKLRWHNIHPEVMSHCTGFTPFCVHNIALCLTMMMLAITVVSININNTWGKPNVSLMSTPLLIIFHISYVT